VENSGEKWVKMGAKIYGATTIGDHGKVGGEISNSLFQAYSNKGHDGFLGNSLVGEWCNFGADTNSSNLKNNYSPVKIYSYETNRLEQTNVQFCGVIMGDHSKTGINTMLNTATVVGVHANVFGGGFPPKFIPSFSWGGFGDSERFELEKAYEVAENMMSRRHLELSDFDKEIFNFLNDNLAQ
jgi:UDP-N-acetylglucosamine diphosphorylase/glucosamine-1-phosphate N-acetyltransferase